MSPDENEYLSLRIEPDLKAALRRIAEREGRTVGNLVKHVLRQHVGSDPQFIGVQSPVTPYRIARKKKPRNK